MDVKADINKMKNASKEYENCKDELENMMTKLKKSAGNLNNIWVGGSKDKFVEKEFSFLCNSISKYIKKIEELKCALDHTAKEFSDLDNELK